ncbi:Gfo/Idh/MocA family oxidoreductase [Halogeometricum sp. S1BR25-6]|uniref:Gfo/Idh/MocA family oxidoreductase n=1 Tax=Halogeometricum salsisoli TaxID=2950536 RepID=A0ABU2GL67_9EURY|nr:Gfo/Idh/MocA family oxidoreductase [Halogeometricum sp. S1BR25-6]MDS0301146.1 Gfo/Idh/MocA family oxidoreductase [Halogeometricum sp. S1BR25-6]
MTLSVGFVGAGGIASIHMETLDAAVGGELSGFDDEIVDVELAAVADVDESRAREVAGPRSATAYVDGVELIEEESVDAVVVAVPPFAHGEYERAAADAGVDLFVEKPPGLDTETVRETGQHVDEAGILAQVGYVCRYARITERALELLDGRTVGHIDSTYWAPMPETSWWRERARSGGQIVEQSTHVYDLHRYLAGDVTEAAGSGTDELFADSVDFQDSTSVTMDHESGAVSHVSSACASPEFRFEVRVAAENVVLELDYAEHTLTGTVDGESISFEGDGDWYRREFELFLRAAADDGASGGDDAATKAGMAHGDIRSDFADATETLALTLGAREAAESNRRVTFE